MNRVSSAVAVLLVAFVGVVFAQSGPKNLQLEEGQLGSVPTGWIVTTPGYSAQLVHDSPKTGATCAELARNAQPEAARFGNLMQTFDATPYRGKRIRFRAAVRTELARQADSAALWLRVDREKGKSGFFDNMMDRPIRSREWEYYEIAGDVDGDATQISLGVMLLASGKLWIADASFEVLGEVPKPTIEAAHQLDGRGLQNLTAFARLYGYVRFFHPSDEAAKTDWDDFAIKGVRQVESAVSDEDLAQKLMAIFQPIAPTVTILPTGRAYKLPQDLLATMDAPNRKITYWKHHGVGINPSGKGSPYRSERVRSSASPDNTPLPNEPLRADLGSVTAWIPLALYVDSEGTLPHSGTAAKQSSAIRPRYSGDDRGTRLADVIIAWNVFQHFYPYFDVVKTDWPNALGSALKSAAVDTNEATFALTLRRLIHDLHDGHGGVYLSSDSHKMLPLAWEWVEDQLVVTAVGPSAKGLISPGDAVISVNGKPVAEALAGAEALISGATPQWIRYRALRDLAVTSESEISATIGIQPFRGPTKTVTLPYESANPNQDLEVRPAKIAELEPGIIYIDPARITNEEFESAVPQLERARGIIFEFRGYPRVSPAFLTHLSNDDLKSAQWHVPVVIWPDGHNRQFERGGEWNLQPAKPRFRAKIAFITDGRAISYAESCMGIVEHYKLGAIVGAPTAGTNGNVNPLSLPGGYNITWTGMKVLKQDGSRHHGVGIQPTVPVTRTRTAVAAGRDEFLEAALESVR